MIQRFKEFLRDDSGAVTADSYIVLGGSVWMAAVLVQDIGFATMDVTNKINERLEYTQVLAEILHTHGPDAEQENSGGDDEVVDCVGNPGNNKCVGNAGETPNGDDDWGSGDRGRSR